MASGMIWAIVIIVVIVIIVIVILALSGTFTTSSTTSGKKTGLSVTRNRNPSAVKRTNNNVKKTTKTSSNDKPQITNAAHQRSQANRKVDNFTTTQKKDVVREVKQQQQASIMTKNVNHFSEMFDKSAKNDLGLTEEELDRMAEQYLLENSASNNRSVPKNIHHDPQDQVRARDSMISTIQSSNNRRRSEISVEKMLRDNSEIVSSMMRTTKMNKKGKNMNVTNATNPRQNDSKPRIIRKG